MHNLFNTTLSDEQKDLLFFDFYNNVLKTNSLDDFNTDDKEEMKSIFLNELTRKSRKDEEFRNMFIKLNGKEEIEPPKEVFNTILLTAIANVLNRFLPDLPKSFLSEDEHLLYKIGLTSNQVKMILEFTSYIATLLSETLTTFWAEHIGLIK